jgi:zinc protease
MKTALALLAAALAACAHQPSAPAAAADPEAVLAQRPAVPPLQPFAAPVAKVHELQNGLKVHVVVKPGDGIEALQLVTRLGSSSDPVALPGLASLAMGMLETGSAGRSQTQMAALADSIGAAFGASAGSDGSTIYASAMATRLPDLVSLLADVALRPNLAESEWTRTTSERTAALINLRADPVRAAGRALARAMYGDHPYGRPHDGTVASMKAMQLADARAFLQKLSPRDTALVAVGGAPEERVVELVRAAFEGWKGPADATAGDEPQAAPPPAERPRLVVVDFPGKPQTVMRVGQPALKRSSPDVLSLRVLNAVLGGSFTSRLMQLLREKNGYTYAAHSHFVFGLGDGPFVAAADVKTAVTAAALADMLSELQRASSAAIAPEELSKGRALLAFDLVQGLEHADAALGLFSGLYLYRLPSDELVTFVPRLDQLTSAAILAAAQRTLAPAQMTIVLAGDAKEITAQLQQSSLGLPAPQLRDADGELVQR